MIATHTFLLFIGAVLVLLIAPGPDMALILMRTVSQGRRAGIVTAVGINTGAYVHVLASVLGLSAVLVASAFAFTIIKWVGAGYLLWLGIQALRSSGGILRMESTHQPASGRKLFVQGFISDVLNPKVSIFFLAFLPQFVDIHHPNLSVMQQLLILGVTSNVIAITFNIALVCCASAATGKLRNNPRIVQWLNKATGAVFIALGIRLASERAS